MDSPQSHVAGQAHLSMDFSRQEYWNGLPFPLPGDLPDPGITPASPALAGRFFTAEALGSPPGCPDTPKHRHSGYPDTALDSRVWGSLGTEGLPGAFGTKFFTGTSSRPEHVLLSGHEGRVSESTYTLNKVCFHRTHINKVMYGWKHVASGLPGVMA